MMMIVAIMMQIIIPLLVQSLQRKIDKSMRRMVRVCIIKFLYLGLFSFSKQALS